MALNINQTSGANVPAILNAAGTALAVNDKRQFFQIQNVGTNPLFVCLGSGASSTVFHVVLKGGTGASDGLGGSYSSAGVCYTGIVTVAGTNPLFTVTEM